MDVAVVVVIMSAHRRFHRTRIGVVCRNFGGPYNTSGHVRFVFVADCPAIIIGKPNDTRY